ncbi:CBS domain-containing protein [Deinococcus wulumuqiensis]|uniref:CBS domain-containing protein n=1 Tax=Deinococcus wulumuqiensis TaxID=980427 RepID=A0A345IJ55_9DEIO|nr:CBS domain-containing protein [Deinococcus wulumuqiensis]AXG99727.1 CBS domain-containing protein [Deinococcus wulumuqiensis]
MTILKDIMTRDLTTVSGSATLREVAQKMKAEDIGNVLILDGDKLTGIITDRDIVIRAVADGEDTSAAVGQFATGDVFTMHCHTDVKEAARAMADRQLRRLPVTDHQSGELIGIVSLADLSTRTSGGADEKALEGISQP